MRVSRFVLAMAALLGPSLSYSQSYSPSRQLGKATVPDATLELAEARADEHGATAAPERRSLMGMVMDVLIASAEQQSAQEAALTHQEGARSATSALPKPAVATRAPAAAASPDLVTREQVAVESEP